MEIKAFIRIRPIFQQSQSKALYSIGSDQKTLILKDVAISGGSPGKKPSSTALTEQTCLSDGIYEMDATQVILTIV